MFSAAPRIAANPRQAWLYGLFSSLKLAHDNHDLVILSERPGIAANPRQAWDLRGLTPRVRRSNDVSVGLDPVLELLAEAPRGLPAALELCNVALTDSEFLSEGKL